MEIDSKPTEIDEVDRHIMQLEIELESLGDDDRRRRHGRASRAARARARRGARSAPPRCTPSGSARRTRSAPSPTLQERIEQAKIELERAQREADLGRAAELQYGTIPELEKQLAAAAEAEADADAGGGARSS